MLFATDDHPGTVEGLIMLVCDSSRIIGSKKSDFVCKQYDTEKPKFSLDNFRPHAVLQFS